MSQNTNQRAEKIYNIEHAEHVHIDVSGLSELFEAMKGSPEWLEYTIAMLGSKNHVDKRPMAPGSIKSLQKGDYNVGDIVMSHWQIDQCIGRGSIGSVYEVHHTGYGRLYRSAIKVINSDVSFSPLTERDEKTHTTLDASYRIQQELDSMVELRGTGYIVDYEDHEKVTYSDGSWGIIIRMELLESLSSVLREKKMARDEAVRLGIDICKALEFCHNSHIVHCDVKPSNIYVTKWGGYKLGDFSASGRFDNRQAHDRIGTLKYMAPEVYQGKPFSYNIDTYALGLVLYELLKRDQGNQMNSFSSKEAVLSSRFSGEPLPPIPGLDKPLQSIIMKACSFNPEDRFSSATEMLDEFLKLKVGAATNPARHEP